MKTIKKIPGSNYSNNRSFTAGWQRKTILIILLSFLGGHSLFAQDQFLWVGTSPGNWTDISNWEHVPTSGPGIPATYYPGQNGGANVGGTQDDVVMFSSTYNGNCIINTVHTGLTSAMRIAGIHIKGYTGSITQVNGNRFNVAELGGSGGTGLWNSSGTITTNYGPVLSFDTDQAYQAYFEFDPSSNGFIGGATFVGGITPSYGMLVAVPLTIKNGSKFTFPNDELRIRHDATIENGNDINNSNLGTVVLSNRSGGLLARNYYFGATTHFHNLKVSSAVSTLEFSGSTFIVDNDFSTSGVLGLLNGASQHFKMNAPTGVQMHIKNDIIIGNVFNGTSYTAANAYGTIELVMNGTSNQSISHPYNSLNFNGNLPALEIAKTSGDVTLEGPVTVNNFIKFTEGIVYPLSSTNSQSNLLTTNDLFVINSNTKVLDASDDSYCNGPIRLRTGKTIELPVGKGGKYRAAIVDAVSGVSIDNSTDNLYTAEYFGPTTISVPITSPNLQANLNEVSNCEVWALQKDDVTDSYEMDLSLAFDASSCTGFLYDDFCHLAVSRWDQSGNEWVSHGNDWFQLTNSIIPDLALKSSLSILSADFDRSPGQPDLFTFGNLDEAECDTCDISLYANYCVDSCEFTFDPIYNFGLGGMLDYIKWDFGDGTSNLEHPSHTFSSLGVQTVSVTVCYSTGADSCCATYTFSIFNNDCAPSAAMASILTPPNGNKTALERASDKAIKLEKLVDLKVIPNPSYNGQVQIELMTEEIGIFKYEIANLAGQQLMTGVVSSDRLNLIQTSELIPGSYIITVYLSNEKITRQMMVGQ